MSGGADIAVEAVRFAFGTTRFAFDLAFPAGSRTAVMGPSGSGKSTLLNLVAGFETPDAGRILIGGEDVTGLPPDRRPVSMVFQENNVFGHADVFTNVALGRSPRLRLSARDRADVSEALARVGLEGKEKRRPAELSGGERQRVALARVLVRDRPVLLLDEPLSALDETLRAAMIDLVVELQAERGMTLVMVTHDSDDAARIGQRIVRVEAGRDAGPASP